jgi:tRNA(fMet)-specific endonuclease VapC
VRLALDTNAYKAFGEGDELLAQEVRRAEVIGVPVIVLGELWFGFVNGTQLRQNSETLERFLGTPRVQVLQLDEQTARTFGEIATQLRKSGAAIQQNDIWIAALCKQHGYALATRDRGFQGVLGLELVEVAQPRPRRR